MRATVAAPPPLSLVATCSLGLEPILEAELAGLGHEGMALSPGGVRWRGSWADLERANWRLRTANRVLVEIARWRAPDGDALHAGGRALVRGTAGIELLSPLDPAVWFDPDHPFALAATSSGSRVRDTRWAVLRVKDGLVDGQRERFGRRADVDRRAPALPLRLRLAGDEATLLLDSSGEPLDRRGYRVASHGAPLREQLAAAAILASGWDGRGPVVDPMCGTGTLLAEAAALALGLPPGRLRSGWAFERFPGFDARRFAAIRTEPLPCPGPEVVLFGNDRDPVALRAAADNLARAGLAGRTRLTRGDAFDLAPPAGPGLVVVNPPYGERLAEDPGQWRRLGDLLKQRFRGWTAAVLAGDAALGKHLGLRPRQRIPVRNGPLPMRILVLDLF
ncbi:MAG TPA: hypothetical protein VLA75_02535 [Thermoanaerobaculia bacterium]|nr:hypothetical protein [Thermoanaerobaculia bacterium]